MTKREWETFGRTDSDKDRVERKGPHPASGVKISPWFGVSIESAEVLVCLSSLCFLHSHQAHTFLHRLTANVTNGRSHTHPPLPSPLLGSLEESHPYSNFWRARKTSYITAEFYTHTHTHTHTHKLTLQDP